MFRAFAVVAAFGVGFGVVDAGPAQAVPAGAAILHIASGVAAAAFNYAAVLAIAAAPVPAAAAALLASAIGAFGFAAWRRKRPARA